MAMDLFEPPEPAAGNRPEFTVSELSGAVKRVIEGEFGLVRVRGEIGRVSRPASGHLYYDLKDERAVLAAITWRGQARHLAVQPEEGLEVIATGRLTTYAGQSKYQLIVEELAPAGAGALMAMLEKRRAKLQAEGLFDAARKRPVPFLPDVIGVVTSPSGAVIRDILHRLNGRFPRRVLVWPAAVQGTRCAAEVAAGINGFNAIPPGGAIPRPDVIIVARGGGSLEDLWGFNEEAVVRAAAASTIPLISAIGHETDTTLIDHAADLRAPTPSAAAELAVPVRIELQATVADLGARLLRRVALRLDRGRQRAADLARVLPRPEALTGNAMQRLDQWADRLVRALSDRTTAGRARLDTAVAPMRPALLRRTLDDKRNTLGRAETRLHTRLDHLRQGWRAVHDKWASRLAPAGAGITRRIALGRKQTRRDALRLDPAIARLFDALRRRVEAVDRTRQGLGYRKTLRRGFAVIRAGGHVITGTLAAERAGRVEIEFADGRVDANVTHPRKAHVQKKRQEEKKKPAKDDPPEQGSLF